MSNCGASLSLVAAISEALFVMGQVMEAKCTNEGRRPSNSALVARPPLIVGRSKP